MKNGGAEQCLLKAAEDGEILPREGFSVVMAGRQDSLALQENCGRRIASNWTVVSRNHADCRSVQEAGAGATSSPPGGRDTEGRQEVWWQIDAVWQFLRPDKAAPPPRLRGVSFFGSFAPVSLWALASPHTSTSWTPQGSSLARDRQECVTGPITPSIKGPFRLGPSASPDRAPFLEPGSNQADRPRGFSGHTWCFLCFPLCGVHYRNLSPTACWRCVPLAAPWAQWEKKTTRHMRQTGAGDEGETDFILSPARFFFS